MNRIVGYSLISVGGLGFLFFLRYQGTAIPLNELWFVLSIFTLLAGAFFTARYKLKKPNNLHNGNQSANIEMLKRTGEKVKVTLDNAEVKSRSYEQEVINDKFPSRMKIVDGLYGGNRNYKTQAIQQTYIVFKKEYSGIEYTFISQCTTQNIEMIKMHIDNQGGIDLYIDPKKTANYYFDLPFL